MYAPIVFWSTSAVGSPQHSRITGVIGSCHTDRRQPPKTWDCWGYWQGTKLAGITNQYDIKVSKCKVLEILVSVGDSQKYFNIIILKFWWLCQILSRQWHPKLIWCWHCTQHSGNNFYQKHQYLLKIYLIMGGPGGFLSYQWLQLLFCWPGLER